MALPLRVLDVIDRPIFAPSIETAARRALERILSESDLSVREIAAALGISIRTIERHLAGGRISRERQSWYLRVLDIESAGDQVIIRVRYVAPTKKRFGWSGYRRKRKRPPEPEGVE